jgi:hypothetical protein
MTSSTLSKNIALETTALKQLLTQYARSMGDNDNGPYYLQELKKFHSQIITYDANRHSTYVNYSALNTSDARGRKRLLDIFTKIPLRERPIKRMRREEEGSYISSNSSSLESDDTESLDSVADEKNEHEFHCNHCSFTSTLESVMMEHVMGRNQCNLFREPVIEKPVTLPIEKKNHLSLEDLSNEKKQHDDDTTIGSMLSDDDDDEEEILTPPMIRNDTTKAILPAERNQWRCQNCSYVPRGESNPRDLLRRHCRHCRKGVVTDVDVFNKLYPHVAAKRGVKITE